MDKKNSKNSSIEKKDSSMRKFDDVTFYYDVKSDFCRDLITRVIQKNGFAPEHNYEYFISQGSFEARPVFAYFGEDKGVLAIEWDDGCYQILSEILAPQGDRCGIAIKFFDIVLNKIGAKKIIVEFSPIMRREMLKSLKISESAKENDDVKEFSNIKLGRVICKYSTPIVNISTWDTTLAGSHFSNLRKAKNRFYKNFKVEVLSGKDVSLIPIEEFRNLIDAWKKNRKNTDTVFSEYYSSFFENHFSGSACHIVLKLDGKLCGVCAAILIPDTNGRSDRKNVGRNVGKNDGENNGRNNGRDDRRNVGEHNGKNVYYAINLHDYSVQELGDFLTVLFLDELKRNKFEFMDFGSSDEKLLNYKKKFGIHSTYETQVYYIRLQRRNVSLKMRGA